MANYGMRAALHRQAVAMAPRVFGPLPAPCSLARTPPTAPEVWPQERLNSDPERPGPCLVGVWAIPTFLVPTNWRVITQLSNGYEVHDLDLLSAVAATSPAGPRVRLYFPNESTPQTATAADTRLGRIYLGFSRFPAARTSVDADGVATTRWSDMRFVGGPLRLDQQPQRDPFSATVRIDRSGRVIEERLGP